MKSSHSGVDMGDTSKERALTPPGGIDCPPLEIGSPPKLLTRGIMRGDTHVGDFGDAHQRDNLGRGKHLLRRGAHVEENLCVLFLFLL